MSVEDALAKAREIAARLAGGGGGSIDGAIVSPSYYMMCCFVTLFVSNLRADTVARGMGDMLLHRHNRHTRC